MGYKGDSRVTIYPGKLIVLHCFWFCNIFLSCYDKSILIATIDATIDVLKLRATIKDYN